MELWSRVLQQIENKISKPSFQTWFLKTTAEIEDNVIVVIANNGFSADWLKERYTSLIIQTVSEITGKTFEIKFSYPELSQGGFNSSQEGGKPISSNSIGFSIYDQLNEIIHTLKTQEERIRSLEKMIQADMDKMQPIIEVMNERIKRIEKTVERINVRSRRSKLEQKILDHICIDKWNSAIEQGKIKKLGPNSWFYDYRNEADSDEEG